MSFSRWVRDLERGLVILWDTFLFSSEGGGRGVANAGGGSEGHERVRLQYHVSLAL